MKVTLVGLKTVDYTSKKTGKPVSGITLFVTRPPTIRETDIDGLVVKEIFISSYCELYNSLPELVFGQEYDLKYDTDGRYSFLSEVVPVG